jgi:isocitrate dehydrogenase
VFDFEAGGVAMGMYNLDDSIVGFARSSFTYGLGRGWPVYLSTKNTILKKPTTALQGPLPEGLRRGVRRQVRGQAGITYEHRLIDDMVASA